MTLVGPVQNIMGLLPSADTYHAFRGLFIPYRLQMVLAGNLPDYANSNADEATYFHESVHWWQTSMTGYGHAVWHLYRQMTGLIFNEWREATAAHSPVRVLSLESLLHGTEKRNVRLHAARAAAEITLRWASSRFHLSDPSMKIQDLLSNSPFETESWNVNPLIELDGDHYFLEGRNVIESHAHWNTVMFRSILRGDSIEDIGPADVSPKYRIPFEWFVSQVEQDRSWLFPIVCDLALQTIWNDRPRSEDQWQQTSPSWRFFRLTAAIREGGAAEYDTVAFYRRYDEAARKLLQRCGFEPLAAVAEAALVREKYRLPSMLIEQRMFAAMRFRQRYPFCVASPWIIPAVLDEMAHVFGPPIVQATGQIHLNLPAIPDEPSVSCDPEAFMFEVGAELMLQAFVSQILGIEPEVQPISGRLQCGFSYFNIHGNCQHQISDNCCGSFVPSEGTPFPLDDYPDHDTLGCPFEKFLTAAGINVKELVVLVT